MHLLEKTCVANTVYGWNLDSNNMNWKKPETHKQTRMQCMQRNGQELMHLKAKCKPEKQKLTPSVKSCCYCYLNTEQPVWGNNENSSYYW